MIGRVEINPGTAENVVQALSSCCDRNLYSGTECQFVAGGSITAVDMLSFKLRILENGTATDVDPRDFGFWKRN